MTLFAAGQVKALLDFNCSTQLLKLAAGAQVTFCAPRSPRLECPSSSKGGV